MAFLYLITNRINGKQYVGATVTPVKDRWHRHKCDATHRRNGNQAIARAIEKYGPENFDVLLLTEHPDAEFLFNVLEPVYIAGLGSHGTQGGYNMTWGGDGWLNMKHSEETKQKISKANKGRKRTDEQRQKMSDAHKGKPTWNKGKICPRLSIKGKIVSDEHRKNISIANTGQTRTPEQIQNIKKQFEGKYEYTIQTPSGEIVTVTNLRQFGKQNKVADSNLVKYGKANGYVLLSTKRMIKEYLIEDINTKEQFVVTNLRQFCLAHNSSDAGLLGKYRVNKPYKNLNILSYRLIPDNDNNNNS